jgi:hypothetical protein
MNESNTENMCDTRQCIYCLDQVSLSDITDDHIIAGAWYPDSTPATVQRWTAPACGRCNNSFSSVEQYVHTRLSACIDPTDFAAAGMWEQARNSMDPGRAKKDCDQQHRVRQRAAFRRCLTEMPEPSTATLPFSLSNFENGSRTALFIESDKLESLVGKWARGVYYKLHDQPLSLAAGISVSYPQPGEAAFIFAEIWNHVRSIGFGPGIQIFYFTAEDQTRRADLYVFRIWNQVEFVVSIDDPRTPMLVTIEPCAINRPLGLQTRVPVR